MHKDSHLEAQYVRIVQDFLQDISFQMPLHQADVQMEERVVARCLKFGLPEDRMKSLAKLATNTTEWFFPFLIREPKEAIAIFIAHFFVVDDFKEHFLEDLKQCHSQLVQRRPFKSPILQSIFNHLSKIDEVFGWYVGSTTITAMLDFISSNILESEKKEQMQPTLNTPAFPSFFREQTGIPTPFAHFIFFHTQDRDQLAKYLPLVPDLNTFICHTNDILSFYKESIVGNEKDNNVYDRVRFMGLTPHEALESLQQENKECIARITRMLDIYPEFEYPVRKFICGYTAFHLNNPRYRMSELAIL